MYPCDDGRRFALRLATLFLAGPPHGLSAGRSPVDIRFLVGERSETTAEIVKECLVKFPAARVVEARTLAEERKVGQVYIALGAAALQTAIASGTSAPVLALFTSSEAYNRVMFGTDRRPELTSALFAEVNPLHQLRLTRALYRRRVGVIALFSAGTVHLQSIMEQAARICDLELHRQVLESGDNVVRALLSQRDAQAVLMIPDKNLYKAENLRNVIESTYRRQLGVIGFAPTLVRAGALGAAFSAIDDVLSQLSVVVEAMAVGRVVQPQYPLHWRVLINERVANSLDLVVDDTARALGSVRENS